MSALDRARGRWRELLPLFGVGTGFLIDIPGPCPLCGGKDRFRFFDATGDGDYRCRQCGSGNGLTLIRKRHSWDRPTALAEIDRLVCEAPGDALADTPPDLLDEFARAYDARRLEDRQRWGLPVGGSVPAWGMAQVELSTAIFTPAPEGAGVRAIVVPSMDEGETVDLVAFQARGWRCRIGDAVLLGTGPLNRAHDALDERAGQLRRGAPAPELRLFARPIEWLRASGDGLVVLDWQRFPRRVDPEIVLVCPDAALADAVHATYRYPHGRPATRVLPIG